MSASTRTGDEARRVRPQAGDVIIRGEEEQEDEYARMARIAEEGGQSLAEEEAPEVDAEA